jgi:hypothetical protein
VSSRDSGIFTSRSFFTGSLQAMNCPVTIIVYVCCMGFFKVVLDARGPVSEMAFLPDPKVVGADTNEGLSPHDWAEEWRGLAVMLWEVTGLQREDPHFLRLTAPVMIPVGVAWHMEDWPTYQAACAHARQMIRRIPVEPRAAWWSCWDTEGTA